MIAKPAGWERERAAPIRTQHSRAVPEPKMGTCAKSLILSLPRNGHGDCYMPSSQRPSTHGRPCPVAPCQQHQGKELNLSWMRCLLGASPKKSPMVAPGGKLLSKSPAGDTTSMSH